MESQGLIDINAAFADASARDLAFGGSGQTSVSTKTKKQDKFSIEIRSERLIVNTSAREVNEVFGTGLQEILKAEFEAVTAQPAAATLKRRERYRRAWQKNSGTRSLQDRYGPTRNKGGSLRKGGTPATPPREGEFRLLNDSGRITLTTIRLRKSKQNSTVGVGNINFPANRFASYDAHKGKKRDDRTIDIVRKARQHVPMLRGQASHRTKARFDALLKALADGAVATSQADLRRKKAKLRKMQLRIVKTIARAAVGG